MNDFKKFGWGLLLGLAWIFVFCTKPIVWSSDWLIDWMEIKIEEIRY